LEIPAGYGFKKYITMKKILLMAFALPVYCAGQNVGLGIVPTNAKFEVAGTIGNNVAIMGGDGAGVSIQNNWPTLGFNQYYNANHYNMMAGGGWVQYMDMVNGVFCMDHTNATASNNSFTALVRRLSINMDGNVSVNNSIFPGSLYVGYPANGLPAAIFRGTNYNSLFYEQVGVNLPYRNTYINGGKPGSVAFLNDKPGGYLFLGGGTAKVGINNTNPSSILDVKQINGRGLALIASNSNFNYWDVFVEKNLVENNGDMYLYYNTANLGNFYNGDGLYYYYSDRNMKTNIKPVKDALTGILQLKPKTYRMKFDNPGAVTDIGLIAQETAEVFPEVTSVAKAADLGYGDITTLYGINYNAIGALALQAIKQQQEKIRALQMTINNLRQRIDAARAILK
jgi:hypothetical protein